ncbi:FAD-dependent oxidoreductase [Lysobacter korlensis]|uniref:FAD-dependent oxidoreductase n=1 Tax=Lysobacter korlensis TaxID=553636 RepID=A0ABV6S053_9GAMM
MSRPTSDAEVVVVGGGPVGLATAALLGRLGHEVILAERRHAPTGLDESRAITWMPEGLLFADHMGITGALRADALVRTAHEFRTSPDGPAILDLRLDRLRHRHPYSLNLAQHHSEVALERAVHETPGVTVLRGFTAGGIDQDESGVTVEGVAADGQPTTLRARFGVAADGAGSTKRGAARRLGIDQDFRDYGTFSAVADVELTADPDRADRSWVALDPRRPIGAFAFGPRRWRLIYRVNEGDDRADVVSPAFVEEILRQAYPHATVTRHLWASTFRLGQGQAMHYGSGRWVLVGDAAHAMGPSAGAGMMVGLLGAWRLESAICRHGIPDWGNAVREYEAAQRQASLRVQRGNAMIFRNIAMRNGALASLRSAALTAAGRVPAVADRMARKETLAGLAPAEAPAPARTD